MRFRIVAPQSTLTPATARFSRAGWRLSRLGSNGGSDVLRDERQRACDPKGMLLQHMKNKEDKMSKRITIAILMALGLFLALFALFSFPGLAQVDPGEREAVAGMVADYDMQAMSGAKVQATFAQMSLYFIENQGQVDEQVAYYVQGRDKTLYFTSEGVTFVLDGRRGETLAYGLPGRATQHEHDLRPPRPASAPRRWVLRLEFLGANPDVQPVGVDETEAVISYFRGRPEEWVTGLKTYSKVIYRDLWPGIDLEYSGTVNRLKYQFVVKPGADPAQIRLAYHGARQLSVNESGQLEVATPVGGFRDDAPYAYQEAGNGDQVPVGMAYTLQEDHVYGFALGRYDSKRPLVLDPAVFTYCGYIGGGGTDEGLDIAVDSLGNAYVTGRTRSSEGSFPVAVGPDLTYNGGTNFDAFVAKVRADGLGLAYCGYIGGGETDSGRGIAVDGHGNAYITGIAWSTEADGFPVTVGPDLTHNGGIDTFVAQVKADGTALVYCGYIGGPGPDSDPDIDVDGDGNAYVTGWTRSSESDGFPVAVGPDLSHNGSDDAFVAKVKADGTALLYCGYIGGSVYEYGKGIAVDALGNAFVVGNTASTETDGFPVSVGPGLSHNGDADVFVARVKADGTALDYCGYIGGSQRDDGRGIALDGDGSAYLTGYTESSESDGFPVTVGPDLTFNGSWEAFVTRVQTDGTSLDYCGYIGGSRADQGWDVTVDEDGNAYVAGDTHSTETDGFPLTEGPDLTFGDGSGVRKDGFVAKVISDASGLGYCGYIGGVYDDQAWGIAVNGEGNAYVTGRTDSRSSEGFPVTVGPDLTYTGGSWDAFVARVSTEVLANDLCSNATVIPAGGPFPYSASQFTQGATTSGDDPNQGCGAPWTEYVNSNSVWYSFSPSSNGTLDVETCGSSYYTVLSMFDGECGSFGTSLACNRLFCGLQSRVMLPVTAGQTYYIEVTDYGDPEGGLLHLTAHFTPCVSPGTPSSPSPSDGATDVSLDTDLDWANASDATSYDVYFGTSPSPPYYGSTASSSYSLPTLNDSTHYYWKIVAKNDCGNTDGPVWDLTTCSLPGTPSNPSPDGATGVPLNQDLGWMDAPHATSYDVYFGPGPSPPYLGTTSTSDYPLPRLEEYTLYYWLVVAKNDCGETWGPEWDFTTGANSVPTLGTVDPSSGSGAVGVTTYFTTTWNDADGWEDLKHCYFHIGASPSLVNNVTLLYNAAKNKLWIRSDDGMTWLGGFAPGSSNVLDNSQANLYCSLTTVQGSGDTLSVTWAIEFKPGYEGTKKLGLKCKDRQKAKAKGEWKGTWTIE
jgi:hypothetical protein